MTKFEFGSSSHEIPPDSDEKPSPGFSIESVKHASDASHPIKNVSPDKAKAVDSGKAALRPDLAPDVHDLVRQLRADDESYGALAPTPTSLPVPAESLEETSGAPDSEERIVVGELSSEDRDLKAEHDTAEFETNYASDVGTEVSVSDTLRVKDFAEFPEQGDRPNEGNGHVEDTSPSEPNAATQAVQNANRTLRQYQNAFADDRERLAQHEEHLAGLPSDQPSGKGTAGEELEETTDMRFAAKLLERLCGIAVAAQPGDTSDVPLLILANEEAYNTSLKDNARHFGGLFWTGRKRKKARKRHWLVVALITKFRLREVSASGSMGLLGLAQGTITLTFERRAEPAESLPGEATLVDVASESVSDVPTHLLGDSTQRPEPDQQAAHS